MTLTDKLLSDKLLKSIRMTYHLRLILTPVIILITFFTHRGFDSYGFGMLIFLSYGLLSLFILKFVLKQDAQDKAENFGLAGVILDSIILASLPAFWYEKIDGYSAISMTFILKSKFTIIALIFMAINSIALRPRLTLIMWIASILIFLFYIALALFDQKNSFDLSLNRINPYDNISPLGIFSYLFGIISIGYFIYWRTNFAGKMVKEVLFYQDKMIQQEKRAAIGKMAAGLTHEIKNQLNALNFLELVSEDIQGNDRKYIQYALDCRDRINSMVDEVRALSKNETVKYEVSVIPLKELIPEILTLAKMDEDVSSKKIKCSCEDNLLVKINKNKIIQVLINLIRNAAHAVQHKGAQGLITVKAYRKERWVVIDIEDNGTGIEADKIEKIWQPFYTTKGDKGTGIGLDISKQIIEGHEGKISCESELNIGTKFTIKLPIILDNKED